LFKLQINAGPAAGTTIELVGAMTIGREGADIAVEGDTEMSRRHARLRVEGGRVLVEDLGSTNGTYVGDRRITSPVWLDSDTELRLGLSLPKARRDYLAHPLTRPAAYVVLAYLRRRTSSPEAAADLMAETFAAALLALHTNIEVEEIEIPAAWLLGIARNKLFESYRRGRIEAAARERLGLEPLVLDDTDMALVEELSETDVVNALADLLPPDQLQALRARVIDERDYEEIARDMECSEAVVRKRVSRALRTLRAAREEESS